MNCTLNDSQRIVLSALLDKYEKSKTYKNENQVTQTFYISPSLAMEEYDSDFADVEKVRQYEEELNELVERKLISLQRKGTAIKKIVLNPENIQACYEILNRKDKNARIQEEILFYQSYLGKNPVLRSFCSDQIHLLETGHKPKFAMDEAKELLSLCLFILENKQELLERELSIVRYGNSKLFENKFRSRVCRILQNYGDASELLEGVDDEREREHIILAEHGIYSNPSYIYMKGDAMLYFKGLPPVRLSLDTPVAYSSESMKLLERIDIGALKVMTIENLTSFNRMTEKGYFYLFLSGYHNTAKQRFLMNIAEQNQDISWYHFGDFDPDGFMIIEHLKRKTGIDFLPIHMSLDELSKYQKYGRHMEKSDITKAETLQKNGKYMEEMRFMVEQDCKIEQEIVSWMLMSDKG